MPAKSWPPPEFAVSSRTWTDFMATAAFTTLGCKVNQYETQKILESFEAAGFAIVPFDTKADVYVINSCSVTSVAESKSRYAVRKAARTNPEAKVVVTGCASQMALNQSESMPGADVIVPNPKKLEALSYLLEQYPEFRSLEAPQISIRPAGRTRATLKVQDGCSVMCSYCSIPYTRPGLVSRPADEVLAEAKLLASQGYQEAILTGVLIGAYGEESGSGGPNFEDLVTLLAEQSGLQRLRISSIEMHQVTDCIIELAKEGQIVPHFHIPLQSGDSGVLRDMNRRYDQSQFLDLCAKVKQALPDGMITTDIMVGFPTETDDRFQSSIKVCEEVQFLKAHVFRFSPRYGTPADAWGDPISPTEKQARAAELSRVTTETGRRQVQRFTGRTMRVLVEGKIGKDGLMEGTTDNWITVKFAGSPQMARTFQWVTLQEERGGVAFGELADRPTPNRTSTLPLQANSWA